MQSTTMPPVPAGELILFPFEQWTPSALIDRAQDKGIPFQTTNHRSIVANYLIQNKEHIQKVFDEKIKPVIEIQKRIREDLTNKKIGETDKLSDIDSSIISSNLPKYMDTLHVAYWVLPTEGFIKQHEVPKDEPMPNCLGLIIGDPDSE
jgi:hypothetical protein